MSDNYYEPWPALSYQEFKPTLHLLHMAIQAVGKLKLTRPYEPQWTNVALWLTSHGITTGQILYGSGTFTVEIDFVEHELSCTASWGGKEKFKLHAMSVAAYYAKLLASLNKLGVDISINTTPVQVPNPIPFEQDTQPSPYDEKLVGAWWRIMVSTYRVLRCYHVQYLGRTPPIGLMWGTLELRDARFSGFARQTPDGTPAGFNPRAHIEDSQIEAGLWFGNSTYPHIAYYSFIYPQPAGIEHAQVMPSQAQWNELRGEFILNYDDLRKLKNPENELLHFFESTYQVSAELAGWDAVLTTQLART